MGNKFLTRIANRDIGSHGRVSEKRVALSIGARLTPNSGAMAGAKSDSTLEAKHKYQIESKSSTGKTLAVEHEWLGKITREAKANGAVPALTVSFVHPDGSQKPVGDWVLIPKHHFQELTEE